MADNNWEDVDDGDDDWDQDDGEEIEAESNTHDATSSDSEAVHGSTLVGNKKIVKQIIKLCQEG